MVDGVLLRYRTDAPIRTEQKPQASDRLRIALIKAKRELATLEIIIDLFDDLYSELARNRLNYALRAIRAALEMERPALGLHRPKVMV
jgi:hypothetical protein